MQFNCSYSELVDINSVTPHPHNPNKHPEDQIERLAKLLDYQGQRSPIVVWKETNQVVVGHGRLEAMKKLGWSKVAVDYQSFTDYEQMYAHMTADNGIATWAELDLKDINEMFTDFGPEFDVDLLGLKDFVIEPIEKFEEGLTDEDETPEVKDPITKRGDVWLLGDHRVMCGDSTMIDDVEKLMAGEKADMVYTDPPYGINYDDSRYKGAEKLGSEYWAARRKTSYTPVNKFGKIKGDDFFSVNFLLELFSYCKEVFIWGGNNFPELTKPMESFICWDKKKENQANLLSGDFELCWSKQNHGMKMYRQMWCGFQAKEKSEGKRVHPTQKPVDMFIWFAEKWCEKSKLVVDLFLGSGSTLIACQKTNRKCYGMELDEHYCDVIVNRWQNYTGKKAILESNGKTYDELKANNV